jgi:hypothetical protein
MADTMICGAPIRAGGFSFGFQNKRGIHAQHFAHAEVLCEECYKVWKGEYAALCP